MKFLHKYGTRSIEIQRARRELYFRLALVIAVLVFFAIMLLITRFRPRLEQEAVDNLPNTAHVGDPMKNPRLVELRIEVDGLLKEYAALKNAQDVDLDDLKLLEKALELQREIIRNRGSDIAPKADLDRQESLQALHDEEMGRFLMAQSIRLEEEADAAWEAGDLDKAITQVVAAKNLQEQINSQYSKSSQRNPTRLYELGNKELLWKTQPIAQQADLLKEEAFELVRERKYSEAMQSIQRALYLQQTLNRDFRNSRLASISRLKQFEEAYGFIENAEDVDRVETLLREGQESLQAGNQETALLKAEEAAAVQRRIMARSTASQNEGQDILAAIDKLTDTAASLPAFQRIEDLRQQTRQALLQRDIDGFKRLVAEWLRATQTFVRGFPESDLMARVNTSEVTFLHERRDEIPTILEMVYNHLIPVPGWPGLYMYGTEVPQVLYSSVTGSNPSSLRVPANPIDSVTWMEAMEFISRLSWLMVRPVAL
ncbi:MAG TPA: hypothetical protein VK995_05815, partial [Oceanipulchritudo sp.]|nr:hypothetical protein [Oceanipulchritudo sp.]